MINQRPSRAYLSQCSFAISLAILSVRVLVASESLVALQGHVPKEVQRATLLNRSQPEEMVPLSLVVHLDENLLNQAIEEIYGRNAPTQKHYLSSSEFSQKFSLAEKRQALKDFAKANGLAMDLSQDRADGMVVNVSAPAHVVEQAFHIQLNHYRAADGRDFRGHDTEPMIPASLQENLGAVMGLSNLAGVLHPHLHFRNPKEAAAPSAISGTTGPGGTVAPADIKTIYGLSQTTLTGAGQTVALFELDGYYPPDISHYISTFGLSNTPVTFVGVDGTANICGGGSCNTASPGNGQIEVSLDIEMVLALASGVSRILVYDGPNTGQGVLDTYDRIATDNAAKAVSSSWGASELKFGASFDQSEGQIFQRMAAQGQTMYVASGDSGAYDDGSTISVDDPASQQYVTAVGGTGLSGTVAAPVETAWNSCGTGECLQGNGGSSGGGVSVVWPIPSYQIGVTGQASQTSQSARNVPDVSLNADPASGYAVYVGGSFLQVGGTSAAAPLWAGFTALLNQASLTSGSSLLGFANPTLYQLAAAGSTYSTNFHDVTSGDNGHYTAGTGYDNITGWGSFKGSTLINSLTGILAIIAREQLTNVYAFPNPWDTRKYVNRQVILANIPDDATVKIFTVSGFWVKTLSPANGQTIWDLTNDHGDRVASGLYFYLVKSPAAKTTGEIAIIK